LGRVRMLKGEGLELCEFEMLYTEYLGVIFDTIETTTKRLDQQ